LVLAARLLGELLILECLIFLAETRSDIEDPQALMHGFLCRYAEVAEVEEVDGELATFQVTMATIISGT
jgi:hypothetical protein